MGGSSSAHQPWVGVSHTLMVDKHRKGQNLLAPNMGGRYTFPMRVIAKRTLKEFYEHSLYRDAKGPLEAWHAEASKANWHSHHDIKAQYGNASIIGDETVVFNIAGNKYRLVVNVDYGRQALYVKFVGTHKQYDKLNLK